MPDPAGADARAALDDYLADYGVPDPLELDATRAQLAELGLGRPETAAERAARNDAIDRLRGGATDRAAVRCSGGSPG